MFHNIYKNAGFPPIKYCPIDDIKQNTKERFLSSTHHDINIRQILNQKKNPIIIKTDDENIEVISEI